MVIIVTTYLAYRYDSGFLPTESITPVSEHDPQRDANNAPGNVFAFFYFDADSPTDLVNNYRNISKTYYIDAELFDYQAVSALPGNNTILLDNMRNNEFDTVVRCRTGNFQAFKPAEHELITTN
jgi:hypothetical protein